MKGNLLPFCRMKQTTLIGQLVLLAMMSHFTSGTEDQSLMCYCDLVDLLTCQWNITSERRQDHTSHTKCFLSSKCNYIDIHSDKSELLPITSSQPQLLQATAKFPDKSYERCPFSSSVFVECEGRTVAQIPEFWANEHVKLHPPEKPRVEGANVTWVLGSPHAASVVKTNWKSQLQYRPVEKSWEDVKPVEIQVSSADCVLPEHMLILGGQYEVRVRTIYTKSSLWSEWSPITKWTSTVGIPEHGGGDTIPWFFPSVTASVIVIAIIIIAIFRFHPITCFSFENPMKSPKTCNPFEDFKSWTGPFVTPDSFIKADTEFISPLEIVKVRELTVLCKKDVDQSSFSNSTYFLSQSSKCTMSDQLEPCSKECPYGPAGGGSVEDKVRLVSETSHNSNTVNEVSIGGLLETSSSYKHLQKLRLEVHSPDSGFAAGSDQDSQEDSGSEGLPSPPVMDNVPPIGGTFPCPIPLVPNMADLPDLPFLPFISMPSFGWSPQNNNHFERPPCSFSTNTLMAIPDISDLDCSGILEPASDDYMSVPAKQDQ